MYNDFLFLTIGSAGNEEEYVSNIEISTVFLDIFRALGVMPTYYDLLALIIFCISVFLYRFFPLVHYGFYKF